ncbi:MAG: hypothetical protein J6A44_04520 [Paludibacteraceae bacterium]|nr:hypothetical protein [Paludibacteraceae bacterium]
MNFKRFLAHIKRQRNKVATFLKSRDVVTFLFFFLLAFFMWYMYSIGTQREISRKIPIKYVGIPEDIQLDKPLPEKLGFVIKDEGKIIWSYKKSLFDTLTIDLSETFEQNKTLELKFEEQFQKILAHLSPTTKIVELAPNYFTTPYIRLYSKSVPVVLSNAVKMAPQHVMFDTISIQPKRITILGTAEAIDTISYLYIEPILGEFDKTKTIVANIIKPNGVELNRPTVNVTIPAEMCTEKEVIVPITLENVPKGINVKTFPAEVKIRFSVSLSHYNSITEETFKVIFNYDDLNLQNNPTTNALQLDYTSGYIFNIRLNPSEVEYVIEHAN